MFLSIFMRRALLKKKALVDNGLVIIFLLLSVYSCWAQSMVQMEETSNKKKAGVLMLCNIPSPTVYSTDPDEKFDSLGLIEGQIVYDADVPYLLLNKKEDIEWADVSLHNSNGYFLDQIFLSELPPNCTHIKVNLKDKNLEGQSCFIRVKLDDRTRFFSILTR